MCVDCAIVRASDSFMATAAAGRVCVCWASRTIYMAGLTARRLSGGAAAA
jgi:hypothetical protein